MRSGSLHKYWIPLASLLLFGAIAFILWQHQNRHDRELFNRHIETSVEQVRIRVEGLMNARLASLELMADRWVERQPPDFSHQRFQNFAMALSRNYSGYDGIFCTDPSGTIQWVFPVDEHAEAVGKPLAEYPNRGNAEDFEIPKDKIHVLTTSTVLSEQGVHHFHAVRPLMYRDALIGHLAGFFSVEQIMMLCLTKELLNDCHISVFEAGRTIFEHGGAGGMNARKESDGSPALHRGIRDIQFGDKIWTISLALGQNAYPAGVRKNTAILSFGLTLAAALSLLLHLLIKRMEMYKASRDRAILEVNERRKAQAALRENEGRLQALLDELTAKNAELESFVYTVSHDLKTPIVTIEGFIGALREDFANQISEVGELYLGHMSNAARKMGQLINDLLNLSRIGRLEGKKTEFSMNIPVQDALATLQSQIDAAGIRVSIQNHLPTVFADRKRIEQAVYNLLSNAVKYIGRDNQAPCIEIGCSENGSGHGEAKVFWIRDNGIGIDQKYFDKIFQIFERLPAAKALGEGTGIGLAIVKRIIEHHDGRIWLASEMGKGTTFFFTVNSKEAGWTANPQEF
ncbi:MAG: ATP-binding protein [Desulfobacterales bacterium]